MQLLLTISAAAERMSLGRSKTYELIQEGLLNPVRIGRAVRIPASEVERFVAKLQAEQADSEEAEAR